MFENSVYLTLCILCSWGSILLVDVWNSKHYRSTQNLKIIVILREYKQFYKNFILNSLNIQHNYFQSTSMK